MWLLSIELDVIGVSLATERKVLTVAACAKILWMEMPGVGIQEQGEVQCIGSKKE
jgi:hypothetical protein